MEEGIIVEFIDRQKILCAVVQEVKNQRLKLLTENDREVNLSSNRLSHKSRMVLDLSLGRIKTIDALKGIAFRRKQLTQQVNIRDLWEILNSEQEWIDLATMTEFCFSNQATCDHESAIVRAFFQNRLYFKFDQNRFFPIPEEQVERNIAQERETARKAKRIESGALWVRSQLQQDRRPLLSALSEDEAACLDILKSCYLLDKDSPHHDEGKEIMARAGIDDRERLFSLFVDFGLFDSNENIELYRQEIPLEFPAEVLSHADNIASTCSLPLESPDRKDLTHLSLMTIDGQSTLDYDDAISFEDYGDSCCLGVHIVDVAHYVKKDDPIDREARLRASSIYMPDRKIPMLPPGLAEGFCSLKAGELRPAISMLIHLGKTSEILDYEIVPSLIRVQRQLTYYDVNMVADSSREIASLCDIAMRFRQKRLSDGAVQITLPDVNVWISDSGEISVNRINRESPGRMMVAEIMIMANWLMAKFLTSHGISAVFRSQPGPRDRLYKGCEGSLIQNYMQRRLLSRFMLLNQAERHSGLGLDAYVTATSPIRKYYDLVTQRQIRSVFGQEAPYSAQEIDQIIQRLQEPMLKVSRMQYQRNRYWILKYLESRIGQKEDAIVIGRRRNAYQILMTEYMLECDLATTSRIELKPENQIQVTIQHVNARKDVLSVFMA
ncbi:MAG: RNB domain-containing ribonuclease [Deltaproteobacteria bacterium]|nr:RNB domain-containing ribonuclease [Deltaproteobacteria bacterium]